MRNTLLAALLSLFTANAHAGFESCGDIDVEVDARCEVKTGVTCEVDCQPANFDLACRGKARAQCSGTCTGAAQVDCTGSCEAQCQADCEADSDFSCTGDCGASCEASCEAGCKSQGEAECNDSACRGRLEARCAASCTAACGVDCDLHCKDAPIECEGSCQASCEGSCGVESNLDCNVACETDIHAQCEGQLTSPCQADCRREGEGALFCDGQYVDRGNSLSECIDALDAYLKSHVEVEGSAEANCEGNGCEGSAEGSVSTTCSARPQPTQSGSSSTLALAWLFLASCTLRRRR